MAYTLFRLMRSGRSRDLVSRCFAIGVTAAFLIAGRCPAGEIAAPEIQLAHFVRIKYGNGAAQRLARWRELIATTRHEPEIEKVTRVNIFFNRVPYVPDQENWGAADYWATPLEMLAVNGGDCEDYAIAKYFSLLELGVRPEQLRFWYVAAADSGENHMVLAYEPAPGLAPLILDNLTDDIRPAPVRLDLLRQLSFNADGVWVRRKDGHDEKIGRPERMQQWFDLMVRRFRELRRSEMAGTSPYSAPVALAGPIQARLD